MLGYVFRRSAQSLIAVAGLLVLVFFLSRLTGDPAYLYLPLDSTEAQRAAFNELHGFNDPLYMQFGRYLMDLLRLDFGIALSRNQPAMLVTLQAFPETLKLAAIAMTLAIVGALVVGSLAAARPDGFFDRLSTTASLAGASAPDFWIAIVAILIFSVSLGLLPTSAPARRCTGSCRSPC